MKINDKENTMRKDDLIPNFKRLTLKLVLCLYGGANVGKSETLTGLGRALLSNVRYFYEQKGQHGSRDRRIALKYRRHIIGICTYGDDQDAIDRNFKFFEDQGCDIGVTAARVEGGKDLKSYVTSRCKSIKVASIEKKDVANGYSQGVVKAVCIDHFIESLKCGGIEKIRSMFKMI